MKKTLIFAALVLLSGCTDASRDKMLGYGKAYRVEILSGGQIVRTYTSSGKVLTEEHSDGYYFNDAATGKLVEVSGQVIITRVD